MRPMYKNPPVCIRCGHIYIKTDDLNKKICLCDNPVLVTASEAKGKSIKDLQREHRLNST